MVDCPSCESGAKLVRLPMEIGIKGFQCTLAGDYPKGEGCAYIYEDEEYYDTWPEQVKGAKKAAPATPLSLKLPIKSTPPTPSTPVGRTLPQKMPLAASPVITTPPTKAAADGSDDSSDDDAGDDDDPEMSQKECNVRALERGANMVVQRVAVMPSLTVKGDENANDPKYKRGFNAPRRIEGAAPIPIREGYVGRRLGARMMVSSKFGNGFKALDGMPPIDMAALLAAQLMAAPPPPAEVKPEIKAIVAPPPPEYIPLVVWSPNEDDLKKAAETNTILTPIIVEPIVGIKLRPHQREGVQFMIECVLTQRNFEGCGAILADDMGLGKTLQSVALMFTLLRQGFEKGKPIARRAIVVCPTSLVSNWANEIKKWTGDHLKIVALSEANREKALDGIQQYLSMTTGIQVIIISYETFRMHCAKFTKAEHGCDLLICDEAHRLKNDKTQIYEALHGLPCKRRVLLSGTPLQNDLKEFYAMVNFTNPGVLGDRRQFTKIYESPVLRGREPDATPSEVKIGNERSGQLSTIVNQFILRRTNALLSAHLPPKVVQVVCCRMTPLQSKLYRHFISSKAVRNVLNDEGKAGVQVLPLITSLKALCNHPKLVYNQRTNGKTGGIQNMDHLFPPNFRDEGHLPHWSGKMDVLDRLLTTVRRTSNDRVVLVSNFTSTLDMFVTMCQVRNWPCIRLDGSTSVKKRQKLVDQLTDRKQDVFVFLLSSKAGGCGLNLIGANRLILFDPDWNPAVDKQAAARIWRDGQPKRCFVYRFLCTGTIEEKVYQRQLSKEGLADVLGGQAQANTISTEDLMDLFTLQDDMASDTHDYLGCECCDDDDEELERRKKKTTRKPRKEKEKKPRKKKKKDGDESEDSDAGDAEGDEKDKPAAGADGAAAAADGDKKEGDEAKPAADGVAAMDDKKDGGDDDGDDADGDGAAKEPKVAREKRIVTGLTARRLQRGEPKEDDLQRWAHHTHTTSVPDPAFRKSHSRTPYVDERPKWAHQMAEAAKAAAAAAALLPPPPVDIFAPRTNHLAGAGRGRGIGRGRITTPSALTSGFKSVGGGASAGPAGAPSGPISSGGGYGMAGDGSTEGGLAPERPNYVSFVFSCEVTGKPLAGPEEEQAKSMTSIDHNWVPSADELLGRDKRLKDEDEEKEDDGDYKDVDNPDGDDNADGGGAEDGDNENGKKKKKLKKKGKKIDDGDDEKAPDGDANGNGDNEEEQEVKPKKGRAKKKAARKKAAPKKKRGKKGIVDEDEHNNNGDASPSTTSTANGDTPTSNGAAASSSDAPAAAGVGMDMSYSTTRTCICTVVCDDDFATECDVCGTPFGSSAPPAVNGRGRVSRIRKPTQRAVTPPVETSPARGGRKPRAPKKEKAEAKPKAKRGRGKAGSPAITISDSDNDSVANGRNSPAMGHTTPPISPATTMALDGLPDIPDDAPIELMLSPDPTPPPPPQQTLRPPAAAPPSSLSALRGPPAITSPSLTAAASPASSSSSSSSSTDKSPNGKRKRLTKKASNEPISVDDDDGVKEMFAAPDLKEKEVAKHTGSGKGAASSTPASKRSRIDDDDNDDAFMAPSSTGKPTPAAAATAAPKVSKLAKRTPSAAAAPAPVIATPSKPATKVIALSDSDDD